MSEDLASVKPGPEGWLGSDGDRRLWDEGAEQTPELFIRRPAKQPNPAALQKCRDLMAEEGVEDGVWLRAIEKYVFGSYLDWLPQIIGSCVGSSFMRGATHRTLWESFVLGDPEEIWGPRWSEPTMSLPSPPMDNNQQDKNMIHAAEMAKNQHRRHVDHVLKELHGDESGTGKTD